MDFVVVVVEQEVEEEVTAVAVVVEVVVAVVDVQEAAPLLALYQHNARHETRLIELCIYILRCHPWLLFSWHFCSPRLLRELLLLNCLRRGMLCNLASAFAINNL